jgi:Plants and Prokaryotes Conserved (PCC) domain
LKPGSAKTVRCAFASLFCELLQFARGQGLAGSSFKAIGALSHAKLGWFNWETKKYDPACVLDEQVELLSLIGDIALSDGEPQVHEHGQPRSGGHYWSIRICLQDTANDPLSRLPGYSAVAALHSQHLNPPTLCLLKYDY